MQIDRDWRKFLDSIEGDVIEIHKHEHIEDFEIVDPPNQQEDQEENHGGNDVCQDVQDSPERIEANSSNNKNEDNQENQTSDNNITDTSDLEKEDFDNDFDFKNEGGEGNNKQSFEIEIERLKKRRLAVEFARIISKIAEDLTGYPVDGDDEWDITAIMKRKINYRSLASCRQSREKERVILILDTSGSCYRQANFYNEIARVALKQGDIELYLAPNAEIQYKWNREWEEIDTWNWQWQNRTIIFFGDFDGGDMVVKASWKNKIYWFSSEGDRYKDMDEHSWCSYTLEDFKGYYYDCENEDDFIKLTKKIR